MEICSAPLANSKCSSRLFQSSRSSPASWARSWIFSRLSSGFFGSFSKLATAAFQASICFSTPSLAFSSVTRRQRLERLARRLDDRRARLLGLIEIVEVGGLDVLLGRVVLRLLRAGFRQRQEQRQDRDQQRDRLVLGLRRVVQLIARLAHCRPLICARRAVRRVRGLNRIPRLRRSAARAQEAGSRRLSTSACPGAFGDEFATEANDRLTQAVVGLAQALRLGFARRGARPQAVGLRARPPGDPRAPPASPLPPRSSAAVNARRRTESSCSRSLASAGGSAKGRAPGNCAYSGLGRSFSPPGGGARPGGRRGRRPPAQPQRLGLALFEAALEIGDRRLGGEQRAVAAVLREAQLPRQVLDAAVRGGAGLRRPRACVLLQLRRRLREATLGGVALALEVVHARSRGRRSRRRDGATFARERRELRALAGDLLRLVRDLGVAARRSRPPARPSAICAAAHCVLRRVGAALD